MARDPNEPIQLKEYEVTVRGIKTTVQLSDEDAQLRQDAGEELKAKGSVELTEPVEPNVTASDEDLVSGKSRTAANKSRTADSK